MIKIDACADCIHPFQMITEIRDLIERRLPKDDHKKMSKLLTNLLNDEMRQRNSIITAPEIERTVSVSYRLD